MLIYPDTRVIFQYSPHISSDKCRLNVVIGLSLCTHGPGRPLLLNRGDVRRATGNTGEATSLLSLSLSLPLPLPFSFALCLFHSTWGKRERGSHCITGHSFFLSLSLSHTPSNTHTTA